MQMNQKQEFSKLFSIFSQVVHRLSEEQYKQILTGEGELIFQRRNEKKRIVGKKEAASESGLVVSIKDKLIKLSCREEGLKLLLESKAVKKNTLVDLASAFHVHILKSDRKQVMAEKIVEQVIGTKLRSNAIREINLKRQ
jgi:hypothetical protein